MPQCPVCQTTDLLPQALCCPTCGWDLRPYPFMAEFIPDFNQKQETQLRCAQQLWQTINHQKAQILQLQSQLQEATRTESYLQSQVHQADRNQSPIQQPLQEQEPQGQETQYPHPQIHQPLAVGLSREPKWSPTHLVSAPPTSHPHSPPPPSEGSQPVAVSESPAGGDPMLQLPDLSLMNDAEPVSLPSLTTTATESSIAPELRQDYHFQVITVNAQGQLGQIEKQANWGFREDLGDRIGLDMVAIPGGQYLMGSAATESGRDTSEGPQHLVTVKSFFMGRYPINQAQWRAVAALPPVNRSLNPEPANFEGEDRPVEQVSWNEAVEFCARLAWRTGRPYRLPSEAEWEYACRAGTTTPFHFGATLTTDLANYDGNYTYAREPEGIYRQQTRAQDHLSAANAFGLCDMHGNVWEWCADHWHGDYQNAPEDGRAWELDDTYYRLLRGGAWYCLPAMCRSAQRHWDQPDHGGSGISFRVVCTWI